MLVCDWAPEDNFVSNKRPASIYRAAFVIFLYEEVYPQPFEKRFWQNGAHKTKEILLLVKFFVITQTFIMHTAISYYFTQTVDINSMETCMHNTCMGLIRLYGNLT